MVWFFSRGGGAQLRLETRFDNRTREYVLEIAWPDRAPETERFADEESFQERVTALEDKLALERWHQVGGPKMLPHGWRGPIPH